MELVVWAGRFPRAWAAAPPWVRARLTAAGGPGTGAGQVGPAFSRRHLRRVQCRATGKVRVSTIFWAGFDQFRLVQICATLLVSPGFVR